MALLDFNMDEKGDLIIYDDGNVSTDNIGDINITRENQLRNLIQKLFFYSNTDEKNFISSFVGKKITNVYKMESDIENSISYTIFKYYPTDIETMFIKPTCLIKDQTAYVYFIYINEQLKSQILDILTVSI